MNYSSKLLQHFRNPHNFGPLKNPSITSQVGNPRCGDVMKLYLKIDKNKDNQDFIKDISFETMGCAAAIATSSILTQLAKSKTLKEALDLNNKDIVDSLDGMPLPKVHCSLLAIEALVAAIHNFYKQEKYPIPDSLQQRYIRINTTCKLEK